MPGAKAFFDTNILLYLLSPDAAKADRAEDVLAAGGTVSVQVLNEFASVSRGKLGMTWAEINDVLAMVQSICETEPLTLETHHRGRSLAERHGLSVYDAMIVSAALLAGCEILYTEDMQDGQVFDGQLTIRNPFR